MTCNQCRHFSVSEVSAKNIRARILYVCSHPDSGQRILRALKKFVECPANNHYARREILAMMEILDDDDPEKIAWTKNSDNFSRLPEAWSRLKGQVDGIEIPRPEWCFLL